MKQPVVTAKRIYKELDNIEDEIKNLGSAKKKSIDIILEEIQVLVSKVRENIRKLELSE